MREPGGGVNDLGHVQGVKGVEALMAGFVRVLRRQEHPGAAFQKRNVVEVRWETHTEQPRITVVPTHAGALDPPFDVAVKHPLRVEQVLFVPGADAQHPPVFGDGFGDLVDAFVPVAARNNEDCAVGRRVAFVPAEIQAGVVQVVGEQQVQHVLVPLFSGS